MPARDTHYVPQAYLRRWTDDGHRVWAYRLLVAHENEPEWQLKSIRGLAYQRDLYTTFSEGREADDFERWIKKEFEDPGLQAIDKIVKNARLAPTEFQALARFVAAQDVRTPSSLGEALEGWKEEMPELLTETLQSSIRRMEEARRRGIPLKANNKPKNYFSDLFRIDVQRPPEGEQFGTVRAEVTAGRDLWIASLRHLLTGAANILWGHNWSIVSPDGEEQWITSDHPVLRLNYNTAENYDFGGGWGNPGSEILMPLSPRYLLYTQVGRKHPTRMVFSKDLTRSIQSLIAERASRWIFAKLPAAWVGQVRPRKIDAQLVSSEREAWKRWQESQTETI